MKPITIIGAPLDLGAGRRGVDMGPSALRVADLSQFLMELGYEVQDVGDVPVSIPRDIEIRGREKQVLEGNYGHLPSAGFDGRKNTQGPTAPHHLGGRSLHCHGNFGRSCQILSSSRGINRLNMVRRPCRF